MTTAFQSDAFQTNAFQIDAAPVVASTLRGGWDEKADKRIKRELREDAKRFKSKREQLREIIAKAYDPDHGKVAAEVQAVAAPYVERLESGKSQVDYAAIERNKAVMAEILSFQDALRREYQARMDIENDDEDVMIVAALWN